MKAKKFLSNEMEGDIEVIKHHVIDIEIDEKPIRFVCEMYFDVGDDPEEDWFKRGIITDMDGELVSIDIKKFLEELEEYLEEYDEELEPDEYEEIMKLEKYKDYELYFK